MVWSNHWAPGWPLLAATGGSLVVGYIMGRLSVSPQKKGVSKSFNSGGDPILAYCLQHSTPLQPVQVKLMEDTLQHTMSMMLGAPEVISLNAALIRALKARRVLDVGVFTGASSLAAALALPPDGQVIACDIDEEFTREARKKWAEAGVENKID